MADLDDFFAKKDRKKSKAVKKFTTADEMAKKLDEPKQKPEVRPKKERPVQEGEEPTRQKVSLRLQHAEIYQLSRTFNLSNHPAPIFPHFISFVFALDTSNTVSISCLHCDLLPRL